MNELANDDVTNHSRPVSSTADNTRTTIATLATLGAAAALGSLLILARAEQLQPLLPEPIVRIFNPTPRPLPFLPSPTPQTSAAPQPKYPAGAQFDAATLPTISINQMFSQQAWLLTSNTLVAIDTANQANRVRTEYPVTNFAFHPATGTLAYLQGEALYRDSTFEVRNFSVYLRTADGTSKKVYAYPYQAGQGTTTPVQLQELAFSDDGKWLAITVTDGLYVYDVEQDRVTEVIKNATTEYSRPFFSPDGSKILLQAKTNSPQATQTELLVVKLLDQSVISIPRDSKYGFRAPLGWLDENSIFAHETQLLTEPHISNFVAVDTATGVSTNLAQNGLSYVSNLEVKNNKTYLAEYLVQEENDTIGTTASLTEYDHVAATSTQLLPANMLVESTFFFSADTTSNTLLISTMDPNNKQEIIRLHDLSPGLPVIVTLRNARFAASTL